MNEIEILLKIRDQVSGKVGGIAGKLKSAFRSIPGPVKVAVAAALAGIVAITAAAINMAAEFEQGMREVNTLVNLGANEFGRLQDQVLDLSRDIGIAANKVVPALYQAISAGVPRENAIEFLRVAATAAIGGVTTLEVAVDGLTTALNAFGIPASEASRVADVFFAAVKAGKTTMEELSASLFNVAPLASAVGASLEETVAAMAALTTAGTPTSVAATQVRAAIVGLIKPSDDLTAIFNAVGFASGEMAIKQIGLVESMRLVQEATGGSASHLQKLVGSVEAVQAILALTGAQGEAFKTTLDGMQTESGQAQQAADEMNESLARQWAILKNNLNVTLIELGSTVLPALKDLLINHLIPKFREWSETAVEAAEGLAAIWLDGQNAEATLRNMSPPARTLAEDMLTLADAIGSVVNIASKLGKGLGFVFDAVVTDNVNFVKDSIGFLNSALPEVRKGAWEAEQGMGSFETATYSSASSVGLLSDNVTWLGNQINTAVEETGNLSDGIDTLGGNTLDLTGATFGATDATNAQIGATRAATAATNNRIAAQQKLNQLLSKAAYSGVEYARKFYEPAIERAEARLVTAQDAFQAAKDAYARSRGTGDFQRQDAAKQAIADAREEIALRERILAQGRTLQAEYIAEARENFSKVMRQGDENIRALSGRGAGSGPQVGNGRSEKTVVNNFTYNQNAPTTVDGMQKEVEKAFTQGIDHGQFRGRVQVITR